MLRDELASILGKDSVWDDEATLARYSSDQSFVEPRRPDAVAFVRTPEQVQAVLAYANKTATPVVPYSSGLNLHGAAIARRGGIVLDCSRMDSITMVDENNWFAVIEPGVTLQQLQDHLAKHQLRAMLPWGVPPARSALTSVVERDPALASASFEYGNDLLMDTEIVLPYGDIFKTGLWSAGGRPGSHMGPVRSMLYRFWTAAQGTMGVITKICIKVEYLPQRRKIFLFPFDSFFEAIAPLKAIQRKEIGVECFLLNQFNLAALFCEDWTIPDAFPAQKTNSNRFAALLKELPPWAMIVCLSGGPRFPEDKIAYEERALQKIAADMKLRPGSLNGRENCLLEECLRPWSILKKFRYKGSVHDLSFKSPVLLVPEFQKIITRVANKYNYPVDDIGTYILPVERGRGAHCEFDFHCDHTSGPDVERIRNLWLEASEQLIAEGAFFDRPYGAWAAMMYQRTGSYTQKLKDLKQELDAKNILNPGHLCF